MAKQKESTNAGKIQLNKNQASKMQEDVKQEDD